MTPAANFVQGQKPLAPHPSGNTGVETREERGSAPSSEGRVAGPVSTSALLALAGGCDAIGGGIALPQPGATPRKTRQEDAGEIADLHEHEESETGSDRCDQRGAVGECHAAEADCHKNCENREGPGADRSAGGYRNHGRHQGGDQHGHLPSLCISTRTPAPIVLPRFKISKHSPVTGTAFSMTSVSTMEHTTGGGTLFQQTSGPAIRYVYRTGLSYDRSAGSSNNCCLNPEESSHSLALKTTARVMT
ncbi:hypothetical protein RHE_CH03390 [Rhizobium etli CFN 42]|uniref:Uncharacterized protein n=1 Tax=Rhizobium etli (strain ATCC 51251 / DSM 11541 / JCM 21823 / NBRC 15573 / CFN 42) TaxID=347834 RepID=Q2K4T3_RHIEC|nr:hypothetical protein RHE_CH03390 [Rhizobium etli CFN 42]